MGVKLTETEVSHIRQMHLLGHSLGAIAAKMGRSRSTIERYALGDPFSSGLSCSECSAPISNISKSGRCRPCNVIRNNKRPDLVAKRMDGKRRAMADPIKYAKACRVARENIRKAMENPETRAKFVELGKVKAATYFADPEIRARVNDPALRKEIGRKISETRMAWCPPEYRELHFSLTRSRNCTAPEARALIAAQIKADLARLSPFERQQRALEKGAQLVANDRAPMFGEALKVVGE